MMIPRRHNVAHAVRVFGVAVAGAVVVIGIYLPVMGQLDWALLPFLLAFVPYALADVAAWFMEEGAGTSNVLSRSRRHPFH